MFTYDELDTISMMAKGAVLSAEQAMRDKPEDDLMHESAMLWIASCNEVIAKVDEALEVLEDAERK
jgi:hypothetical protein